MVKNRAEYTANLVSKYVYLALVSFVILCGTAGFSYATVATVPTAPVASTASTAPTTKVNAPAKSAVSDVAVATQSTTVKKLAIKNSDALVKTSKDAENIYTLKRRLEIEKIKADIEKARNGGDNKSSMLGDTIVTSVYVDNTDPVYGKYATLQFIDGSVLDVEVGAMVGKYKVVDITMSGVTLSLANCKRGDNCRRTINIGRLYAKDNSKNDKSAKVDTNVTATPVVNMRNENNSSRADAEQMVPPIVYH